MKRQRKEVEQRRNLKEKKMNGQQKNLLDK